MSDTTNPENPTASPDNNELEQLLAEKIKLDSILMEKFSRKVTIMFTDIKGSTSYYETRGDLAGRTMIHQHNSIVLPIIDKHKGTLLKTIGDATMSLYENADDGLRAATEIQKSLLDYNKGRPVGEQIKVRCGLNSGIGLVENNDVYGDVVNVTARIESQASAGDIFISEQIYDELRSDDEFIFRFVNAAKVKGKDEPIKIYRLVWNAEDLKLGTSRSGVSLVAAKRSGYYHLEVSLNGDKLKVSGSFQTDGEVKPVKQSADLAFDREDIDACADRVITIFNRAGGLKKVSNDFLIELKQLGRMLYESLIPEVIRKGLDDAPEGNMLISMDESLVRIPWEMLYNGTQFLNQKFGIGRTVTTRQAVSGTSRAVSNPLRMLLLCDPQNNLPAAAREKKEILAATADYKDYLSVNATKEAQVTTTYVTSRIHSYDIIHYAGHAEQDSDKPGHGGWLLQDAPFTAATIGALAGDLPMPALVFSNACHTGEWKTSDAFVQRVFSLANAFLLSGVQHYIGTFWDIPDEPSCHFATKFYGNLAQGMTLGEAMLGARTSLIETFGEDTIFWASYLLYGDPTSRYVTGAATESTGTEADEPPLLRSADSYAAAPPAKSSSTMMIAGGALALVCIVAGYFMFGGSKPQQVQVVQSSAQQQDSAASDKQMDELVKSLAESYRSGAVQKAATPGDGWTSPPFSIVIMEINGGSGSNDPLIEKINQGLSTNAGISIVERKLLNKMLAELKLSASALTDPATSVKLGKILSARIMVSGTLSTEGGKAALMLKFIDTETTEVRKMLAIESKGKEIDKAAITDLSGQIGAWVKEEFPVQGKVTAVAANQCKINIGRQHGVKKGDVLEAVMENGKGTGLFTVLAELQLTEVDKTSATAQIKGDGKGLDKDVKVRVKKG